MHTVDLSTLYTAVNEGLLTLLSGLAIWLAAYGKQWLTAHAAFLGEQTDKTLADGLNRALSNGVQIAMQQVDKVEAAHPTLTTQGAISAWAAQYAIDNSPGAMQRFAGLTPDDLALKALAYLPSPSVPLSAPVAAPAQVEVRNLTPVS